MPEPLPQIPVPKNILVIVADDVGVDVLNAYHAGYEKACGACGFECTDDNDCDAGVSGTGPPCNVQCASGPAVMCEDVCQENLPPTPNIDALRDNGILFRNAWSNPTCTPTRSTIQTGRYGIHTGVLTTQDHLSLCETIIPEVLDGYAHAAIGKWHLGGNPNDHGYSHFSGAQGNLGSYYNWTRIVNGVPANSQVYATKQNVDDAIAWIDQQTGPWFMWLAFNAPHGPYHAPPNHLHSYKTGGSRPALPTVQEEDGFKCPCGTRRLCYSAMLEALDTEIGRLFQSLGDCVLPVTTIIFLGDNGTPKDVTTLPFAPCHAKGTTYQGGINVPLIVSGAGVVNPNRETDALVNMSDLFGTVLELAGIDVAAAGAGSPPIDSVSLLPIINDPSIPTLRNFVYSEGSQKVSTQTARDVEGFKLIRTTTLGGTTTFEFFDLQADPLEGSDLYDDAMPDLSPEQWTSFNLLKAHLESIVPGGCASPGASSQ